MDRGKKARGIIDFFRENWEKFLNKMLDNDFFI